MPTPATQTTASPGNNTSLSAPARALGDSKVPYEVLRYIPQESAEHYKLAPLGVVDGILEVGMTDPEDIKGFDALNFIARSTGMPFKVYQISQQDFEAVLSMYRGLGGEVERAITDLKAEEKGQEKQREIDRRAAEGDAAMLDLSDPLLVRSGQTLGKDIQEDAPTIKIVSTILRYAIDGKAS